MHKYADERIVDWLNEDENGYHPRSDKHGKVLCKFFLDDLLYECEPLRKACKNKDIIYAENYDVGEGPLKWNVDLVLGPPESLKQRKLWERKILEGEPEEIWLAYDAKSLMTEHGKARRNRQRDFAVLQRNIKSFYPRCVVGGAILINMADKFKSPLRDEVTHHTNIQRIVEESVEIFREIERSEPDGGSGISALAAIVLKHTNLEGETTELVREPPAPQKSDVDYYRNTVKTICRALSERYF